MILHRKGRRPRDWSQGEDVASVPPSSLVGQLARQLNVGNLLWTKWTATNSSNL